MSDNTNNDDQDDDPEELERFVGIEDEDADGVEVSQHGAILRELRVRAAVAQDVCCPRHVHQGAVRRRTAARELRGDPGEQPANRPRPHHAAGGRRSPPVRPPTEPARSRSSGPAANVQRVRRRPRGTHCVRPRNRVDSGPTAP